MDTRMQNIVDHFEKMQIDVDGTFQFHCTMCGKCCINREDILLTPKDIYGMSKELAVKPEEFFERYCETYIGDSSRIPIVRLKPRGAIKKCPLLKDRKCLVHASKPAVCAMFPIGRCLRLTRYGNPLEEFATERIEYIFTDPGCGDDTETHTVREWLQDFHIPEEDEFFIKWHQIVFELGSCFREAEEKKYSDRLDMLWMVTFIGLYLSYDTQKDFLSQFEENGQKVTELVKAALSGQGEECHGG